MHEPGISRRDLLRAAGVGAALLAGVGPVKGQEATAPLEPFTGPGPNPHWGSVGPLVQVPGKLPLIQLTDVPVQLETPRAYFLEPITPNAAHFVRWHLDEHPTKVDLSRWRLAVTGEVESELSLSLADLVSDRFEQVTVAAVNQCSGNSRSRFQPRVAGGQWGNGAMGCARWTGARLKDVLAAAKPKAGATQVVFEALDRGKGPEGAPSHAYEKSLELSSVALERALLVWAMNDEPLPLLHGFPLRVVVPGFFSTYWVKALTALRVGATPSQSFWMAKGYRVPSTPRGTTTPEAAARTGDEALPTEPISTMPVRSFVVAPDGASKLPVGLTVAVRGVAFSGRGAIEKVEVSTDGGATWSAAALGPDLGPFAFRSFSLPWTPKATGRHVLMSRATDASGEVQPDEPVWNPGGYLWSRIERQEVMCAPAS